jgi:hypothetical protein
MILRHLDPTKQPKKFCIPDPNLMEKFQYEYTFTYIYHYFLVHHNHYEGMFWHLD